MPDNKTETSQNDYPESGEFILTESQKKELDRRLELHDKGEMTYSTWEEVKNRILSVKKRNFFINL